MKDKRTTIKVNRETKAQFDKLHKRIKCRNHDQLLELIVRLGEYHLNSDRLRDSKEVKRV